LYAKDGWPSIQLQPFLQASLLIALYKVRSERALREEVEQSLLFH
jgi:hypothetical protein